MRPTDTDATVLAAMILAGIAFMLLLADLAVGIWRKFKS